MGVGLMLLQTAAWVVLELQTERVSQHRKQKFPTKTNKNKPRSDLRDTKQRAREIKSTYPCRSHSGNVQMNMVGVVVLASPPRDPIQAPQRAAPPSVAHVQHSNDSSSLVQQGVVEW
jgi:hypothetical protein